MINQENREKQWENLGISSDFMFGKVMQDPELCKELLKRILPDLKIDHIEYPQLQKEINQDREAKGVRLDVYVEADRDTVYNIEMQVKNAGGIPKRSRYYQGMIDLQLLDKGDNSYKKLKCSYVIFICIPDLYGKGRHIYTFENMCKEDTSITMGDETTKIILNASGTQDDVSRELKAFLDYVKGKKAEEIQDDYVEKLEEAIKKARKNREWRWEYMTLLMRDQDNIEYGQELGREQGILGMISALHELDIADDIILQKLQEKFGLAREEAQSYLESV